MEEAMANMSLRFGLSENREEAIIELCEDEKPLGHIISDAASLEGLIRELAKLRRIMSDRVPADLDPMPRIETEAYPAWRVPDTHNAPVPGVMLCLRHSGLGWLGFLLERDRAAQIGEALQRHSRSPSPNTAA